jgi:aspartate aminotransferase-like enzyme
MRQYPIPLVPGPVRVPRQVREVYGRDYGSSDLEDEFFELYRECEAGLQRILETRNQIAILSGEGMVALWAALKSVLRPGDKVVAVATGVFGYGIGDMARSLGAEVETVGFGYDGIADPQKVREVLQRVRPRLVTAVHCETPSGTLNPLGPLGQICREVGALFYVDFVASGGGVRVGVDECNVDLGLLGSQKVLSLMPDLAMVSISAQAWQAIDETGYLGYDALKGWRTAIADRYMPYTHNWHALAGLQTAIQALEEEGIEQVYARHALIAASCRQGLQALGVTLWPADVAFASPTVTAAKMPAGWTWRELDGALRARGMVVGGSYGPMADKVFRIGHMGSQADAGLVNAGLAVLQDILSSR